MNPGEHNQAPRGNNSRYFGNRPRRIGNTRRFNAPQTSTSQYFNQQAPALTPTPPPTAYQEPKRKRSKKPLIFGLLAIVAIAAVVAIVVLIPKNTETAKKDEAKPEDIYSIISTYKTSVIYFDERYATQDGSVRLAITKYERTDILEEEKKTLDENYTKIEEFRKKLDNFSDIKPDQANKELVNLKKSLDTRMPYYKKLKEVYGSALDVAIHQGEQKYIEAFKTAANCDKGNEFADLLTRHYADYVKLYKEKHDNMSESELKNLNKRYAEEYRAIKSSTLLNQIMVEESAKIGSVDSPSKVIDRLEYAGKEAE